MRVLKMIWDPEILIRLVTVGIQMQVRGYCDVGGRRQSCQIPGVKIVL